MYLIMIAVLMVACPIICIAGEVLLFGSATTVLAVFGKWFVFWGVGARLFLAGLRQAIQPEYTARTLLGIREAESLIVVRERGYANLAIGAVGLASLAVGEWRLAAAIIGAVFYGLAGVNHVRRPHRNRLENAAMASGLFMFAVLLAFCLATLASR